MEVIMPIKNGTCGIYAIKTPAGSTYVGSSICIERRFNEHKSQLRRGKHHSSRLQSAFDKYGDKLIFAIVAQCEESQLIENEKLFVQSMCAKLNVATEINNVWSNPETRKKFEAHYRTEKFKINRREIAKNISTRWRAVECSNGEIYKNLTDAANAFGVKASHIMNRIKTGQTGKKIKERFKYLDEDWKEEVSLRERMEASRIKNGTNKRTDESRLKMSISAKKRGVPQKAVAASKIINSIPVEGISLATGEKVFYKSAAEAARSHAVGKVATTQSQINKCLRGVKKTSCGYTWKYADKE